MEEFERLGGKAPIALENMNCKSFSEAPLWKNKMEELLAKYQGKRSPVLLVLIGQEAWTAYLSQADPYVEMCRCWLHWQAVMPLFFRMIQSI